MVELLMEVLHTGPKLYLFGAGHVGQALCRTLAGTPFEIHLIDERDEWLQAAALTGAVSPHPEGWETFLEQAHWGNRRTYVAIMTHRHDTDQQILEQVLHRPAAYIGLIGSQAKWARFRSRLLARGLAASALARVRCPIGIRLGGKAPQEIAISIAAEILGAYYGSKSPLTPGLSVDRREVGADG
jgi:xanthine dehydrogenase accessory factor